MAEIDLDNFDEQQELQEAHASLEDPESTASAAESERSGEQESTISAPEQPASEAQATPSSVSDGQKLMRSLVSDDDEEDELTAQNLRQMLDAAPRWFLRQWKMLLLILFGIFLYITNGYQAQVEMMKETELEAELKDWRYRCITRVSELTLLCRQSQLEQKLREQGDSTLAPSKVAPFVIRVKE